MWVVSRSQTSQGNGFFSGPQERNAVLLMPWFQPTETLARFLPSLRLINLFCFEPLNCSNMLQQHQKTNRTLNPRWAIQSFPWEFGIRPESKSASPRTPDTHQFLLQDLPRLFMVLDLGNGTTCPFVFQGQDRKSFPNHPVILKMNSFLQRQGKRASLDFSQPTQQLLEAWF